MSRTPAGVLAFIDIAASGTTEWSFPIEVGWAVLGGGSGSWLVRPDVTWPVGELATTPGIGWAELVDRGLPPTEVVRRLSRKLPAGSVALTVAFDWHSFWLARLFEASPQVRQFQLGDYWRSLRMFAGRKAIDHLRITEPTQHACRPRAGAEQLRRLWLDATQQPNRSLQWNKR